MKRPIAIATLLLALAGATSSAQSAAECATLMKQGIYDKYRTFSTEAQYQTIQQFFQSNSFSTMADAQSKAGSLGIDITGILGVQLGGNSASTQFQQWQQTLLKTSYAAAAQQGLAAGSVDKISDRITDLVAQCIGQKGLHAYLIPSADPSAFSYTIEYVPLSSVDPTPRGTVAVTPASVAATCSPASLLGAPMDIGPQGRSVSCRRLPTETVVFTANTDHGSPVVTYSAYVVPAPTVALTATPTSIPSGTSSLLTWNASNAATVEIEGFGPVQSSGSMQVTPVSTTQYRAKVVGLDGRALSSFATVTVLPPPPVLTGAHVFYHVTDNDKDDNTTVAVAVLCDGGNSVAAASGTYGHWNDNSDHDYDLQVIQPRERKALIGAGCSIQLTESPKGHDEWHFTWAVQFTFSDGSTTRIDLGGGNVDYDRNVIRKPI